VDRRMPTTLLAALGTACAATAGFNDAPHAEQLAFLVAACVFAAALEAMPSNTTAAHLKKQPIRCTYNWELGQRR
jgi:hypothetical protein